MYFMYRLPSLSCSFPISYTFNQYCLVKVEESLYDSLGSNSVVSCKKYDL